MEEWKIPEELDKLLKKVGVGVRPVDDPYLEESHRVCGIFQRLGAYFVEDEEEFCHPVIKEFTCNALGCSEKFQTLVEYEIHYNGCHRYVCMECNKIRPNPRLLDIHIQETHDSFFKVLAEKQPMYLCFVSDCDLKFSAPEERRQHCIKLHKFPKNYRFDETTREKISKRGKARVKQNNKLSEESMEVSSFQNPDNSSPEAGTSTPSLPEEKSAEKSREKSKGKSKKKSEQILENSMEIDGLKETGKNITKKPNLYKNQKVRTFVPNLPNPPIKSGNFSFPETSMNATVSSSSALAFIPRQLSHKSTAYSKILTQGKSMEKEVLESDAIMELADALPE